MALQVVLQLVLFSLHGSHFEDIDCVRECFLLKIAFETAKVFPALVEKKKKGKENLGFGLSLWKIPQGWRNGVRVGRQGAGGASS